MFVDSHAHLDGERFDADRDEVLARAREAGIANILAIGTGDGPGTLDCAVKLAEKYEFYLRNHRNSSSRSQAGHRCSDFVELEQLAKRPKVIAWGEIGLDYFYDHSAARNAASRFSLRQIGSGASGKDLPIVIHCRPSQDSENAWEDCLRLLQEHWAASGLGGILHCFTGSWEHAKRALDMGFMISFAGNVTFPKAQQIRDAAKQVPLDRMLIETDSPFLAPVPHRGKRNEPAFVVETARQLGELRGLSTEEIGDKPRKISTVLFASRNAGFHLVC